MRNCIITLCAVLYLQVAASWGYPTSESHRLLNERIYYLRDLPTFDCDVHLNPHRDMECTMFREAQSIIDLNLYDVPPELVILFQEKQRRYEEGLRWRDYNNDTYRECHGGYQPWVN